MSDRSFGATTRKLKQVVDQYYECRAVALGERQGERDVE